MSAVSDNKEQFEKVRCSGCKKEQMLLRFSDSQIKKWKASEVKCRRNPKNAVKLPLCSRCSPGNRMEMKCVMCGQTKSLEGFSKAQRKKTDEAHCLDCAQEKVDREPDHAKEVEEIEIIEEMKQMQLRGSYGYPSSAGTRSRVSRNTLAESDRFETETNPGSESWANGNDTFSYPGTAASDTSTPSTQSTRIITGSQWDGFAGDGRPRGNLSITSKVSGGFAKQNAVAKGTDQKAWEQYEREKRRRQHEDESAERDESDDESEASDDPY